MTHKGWKVFGFGLAAAVFAVVAYGVSFGHNLFAAQCSTNNIISCGVTSQAQLASEYQKDNVAAVYAHYGISANMINTQKAVEGTVMKDGRIIYNGRVVATNASSIGREQLNGSTPVVINGVTYYEHQPSSTFLVDSLKVYIYFDANGKFLAAVMLSCGNPVTGTPTTPPVQHVWVCNTDTGVATLMDRSKVTNTSTIVNSQADCHVAQVKVCDTTTWKVMMVDKNKVQPGQKIITNNNECVKPVNKVLVCDTTTGKVTQYDSDKVPSGAKVVANASDCTPPAGKVLVCDTTTGKITVYDSDKVPSGAYVVAHASDCPVPNTCNQNCQPNVNVNQSQSQSQAQSQSQSMVVYQTTAATTTPSAQATTTGAGATASATAETPQSTASAESSAPASVSELPHTGATDLLGQGAGIASLSSAGYAYITSRRKF